MKFYLILLVLCFLISCSQLKPAPVAEFQSTDTHMHIHPSSEQDDDMEFNAGRALFAANSVGIKRAIVLSNAYSKMAYKDFARGQNSFVAREAKKDPTHIAGACAVNPLMDWALDEMKNCKYSGLKILKLHTLASGMDLRKSADLAELKKVLHLAQDLKFTVLIHGNLPKPARGNEAEILLKTLNEFPKTRFIIGHLLGREYELLKNFHHPDFLVEVSAVPIWMKEASNKENLVKTMRAVGMSKFVFGSDWPVFHPAEILHALQELPLSTSELESVVYHNAKALDDLFSAQ